MTSSVAGSSFTIAIAITIIIIMDFDCWWFQFGFGFEVFSFVCSVLSGLRLSVIILAFWRGPTANVCRNQFDSSNSWAAAISITVTGNRLTIFPQTFIQFSVSAIFQFLHARKATPSRLSPKNVGNKSLELPHANWFVALPLNQMQTAIRGQRGSATHK